MSEGHGRTLGCDLDANKSYDLLCAHVPLASCKPRKLFAVEIKDNGLTSDWGTIAKHYQLISEMLDESDGRIPKHESLHSQVRHFLQEQHLNWAHKHSEAATTNLRCFMQTLLNLKRNSRPAPKKFPQLQCLIDKIHCRVRGQNRSESESHSEHRRARSPSQRVPLPAPRRSGNRSPVRRCRSPLHRSRSPLHRGRSPVPRARSPVPHAIPLAARVYDHSSDHDDSNSDGCSSLADKLFAAQTPPPTSSLALSRQSSEKKVTFHLVFGMFRSLRFSEQEKAHTASSGSGASEPEEHNRRDAGDGAPLLDAKTLSSLAQGGAIPAPLPSEYRGLNMKLKQRRRYRGKQPPEEGGEEEPPNNKKKQKTC